MTNRERLYVLSLSLAGGALVLWAGLPGVETKNQESVMALQLFKVTDAKDGTHTIVQARTKGRASKHVAGSRFTAEKASPSEITNFVNAGNKFDVADEEDSAAAPAVEASTEAAPAAPVQAE